MLLTQDVRLWRYASTLWCEEVASSAVPDGSSKRGAALDDSMGQLCQLRLSIGTDAQKQGSAALTGRQVMALISQKGERHSPIL